MSSRISAERYHDISCGHRVVGHGGKCRLLHGHNYRIHFRVEANADQLDDLGMVLDFGVIKKTLCRWLEDTWDHRFLIWEEDPLLPALKEVSAESLVVIPFNPTAEQIANYLVEEVAPTLLEPYGCRLTHCRVEETRKCSASAFVE